MAENQVQIEFTEPYVCNATQLSNGATVHTIIARDGAASDAYSPSDLVAVSLGACMVSTMAISAAKYDLDLSGASVHVIEHAEHGPYRIKAFDVTFNIPIIVTKRQQQSLERAADACPVHHALNPNIAVQTTFNWQKVTD